MGLVESFFNTMATLHEGRTDIFYRLPLSCPAKAYEQLVRRLPLVWALLCRRHPLLGSYVDTLTPDGASLDPREAASRRHTGEAAQDGTSSFEPHFIFDIPNSASDLLEQASQRLVWLPTTWREELLLQQDSRSESSRNDAVIAWLDRYVWNGKRRFLDQHAPYGMSRLVILPPSSTETATDDHVSLDLVLCTAHCISDGLSISSLAGELLQALVSPQLPAEIPELVPQAETTTDVAGATMAFYATISQDVKQCLLHGLLSAPQPDARRDGDFALNEAHFVPLLPPSIEASYPELLPTISPAPSQDSSLSGSRLARLRWFWTIRRVILQIRAANAEKEILSDFRANRAEKEVEEPWWGAQTKWSVVRLSSQHTCALTRLAKLKRIRVGSLLYAVAACALNTLEIKYVSSQSQRESPTATVMGFPYSVSRFLDTRAAGDTLQRAHVQDPLLPPSKLGVKLGFNGVALPPAELFSLPATSVSDAIPLNAFQVAQLWQTARQVQKQLNDIFNEPRFMHADGFLTGLEREMRFRKNGVKDVFEVFKDDELDEVAGQDERRPGLAKKNMQGPGSSLNFSMVGLLDTVLPSRLTLPLETFKDTQDACVEVRDGLMFGVRTRAGEAFGTSFTFRGQLNLELGHDTVVWDTDKVDEYLALMKYIVEAIVAFEQRPHRR